MACRSNLLHAALLAPLRPTQLASSCLSFQTCVHTQILWWSLSAGIMGGAGAADLMPIRPNSKQLSGRICPDLHGRAVSFHSSGLGLVTWPGLETPNRRCAKRSDWQPIYLRPVTIPLFATIGLCKLVVESKQSWKRVKLLENNGLAAGKLSALLYKMEHRLKLCWWKP